jgi:sugar lactone lactonase YvrE
MVANQHCCRPAHSLGMHSCERRREHSARDWNVARLSNGRVFAENFAPGMTDGLRVDASGNVWCSMGWADPAEDGVRCYAPDGDLIGKVHLPEVCGDLCFGGKKRHRLFMAASREIRARRSVRRSAKMVCRWADV